jgi:hypothetical protein
MKRNILLALILCTILSFGACGAPNSVSTAVGDFEMSQDTLMTIEDGHGNALAASPGNILLVVYFTPARNNMVTEDEACSFFYSGSKAAVGGQIYDMECISLEKSGGKVKYGLVFEIANNGYSDQNKPDVELQLPDSPPQPTPEPTATPIPTPVVTPVPTPAPTVSAEVSPTAS